MGYQRVQEIENPELAQDRAKEYYELKGYPKDWIDKRLRKVIVTPDMHRVHHSIIVKETHSNFGFFLSVWDIWFKTYRAQPKLGHDKVHIGVPEIQDGKEQRLDLMLRQPFTQFPTTKD